jgi:hypothetical protein
MLVCDRETCGALGYTSAFGLFLRFGNGVRAARRKRTRVSGDRLYGETNRDLVPAT